MSEPLLIAEVKTKSPYGYEAPMPVEEQFRLAREHGSIVAIHTDERWGGSFQNLGFASLQCHESPPILAKGLHRLHELERALKLATFALVVGYVPPRQLRARCLVEVTSLEQFAELPLGTLAVWNQRDLATGKPKRTSFASARKHWDGWLCQASFIRSPIDVDPEADAILVGEGLASYVKEISDGAV